MTTLTIEQEQWRDELWHGLVAPADPQIMWIFPTWDVSDMSVRDEVEHYDIEVDPILWTGIEAC